MSHFSLIVPLDRGVHPILSIPTTGASWLSPQWTHLLVKRAVVLCGSHFNSFSKIQCDHPGNGQDWRVTFWNLWNRSYPLRVTMANKQKGITWTTVNPHNFNLNMLKFLNKETLSISRLGCPRAYGTPNGISDSC